MRRRDDDDDDNSGKIKANFEEKNHLFALR